MAVQYEFKRAADEYLPTIGRNPVFFFRPVVDGVVLPDKETSKGLFDPEIDVMLGSVYGDGMRAFAQAKDSADPYRFVRANAYAPQVIQARRANAKGVRPIYTYFIERVRPGGNSPMPHGAELPYFFGTLDRFDDPWTALDRRASEIGIDYWTNFAKTGDPNGAGLPVWPAYTAENPVSMNFTNEDVFIRELAETELEKKILSQME